MSGPDCLDYVVGEKYFIIVSHERLLRLDLG